MINETHGPHPYLLSPGGCGDRTTVVDPTRTCRTSRSAPMRRPAHSPGLRRAQAATSCSRPTTRRSNCASWRTSRRTRACLKAFEKELDVHRATAAEVFEAAARRCQRRTSGARPRPSTSVLCTACRHLASPSSSAFSRGRGTGVHRPLHFDRYPGVKKYMDDIRSEGQRKRLRRNRVRPTPVSARDQRAQTRSGASTPSAAPSTRRCRVRLPTSSSAR